MHHEEFNTYFMDNLMKLIRYYIDVDAFFYQLGQSLET